MTLNIEELDRLFVEASQRIHAHWAEVIKEFELSVPQAMALRLLEESQPMRHLAEKMVCDASYVTSLTDNLEKLGLVERRADPNDRRVKQLNLTIAGVELQRRLSAALAEQSPLAVALSPSQQLALHEMLQSVIASRPLGERVGERVGERAATPLIP